MCARKPLSEKFLFSIDGDQYKPTTGPTCRESKGMISCILTRSMTSLRPKDQKSLQKRGQKRDKNQSLQMTARKQFLWFESALFIQDMFFFTLTQNKLRQGNECTRALQPNHCFSYCLIPEYSSQFVSKLQFRDNNFLLTEQGNFPYEIQTCIISN